MNFSFSGSAWFSAYHVGAAAYLRQSGLLPIGKTRLAGTSGGAVVAAAVICQLDLSKNGEGLRYFEDASFRCISKRFMGIGQMIDELSYGLNDILPSNAHLLCSNRLYVNVSKISSIGGGQSRRKLRSVLMSSFATKQALVDALLCSSFVPFYMNGQMSMPYHHDHIEIPGRPYHRSLEKRPRAHVYKDESSNFPRYMDGFFTAMAPILDTQTLTICPFPGRFDICPQSPFLIGDLIQGSTSFITKYASIIPFPIRLNIQRLNAFIPREGVGHLLYDKGWMDAESFFRHASMNGTPMNEIISKYSKK